MSSRLSAPCPGEGLPPRAARAQRAENLARVLLWLVVDDEINDSQQEMKRSRIAHEGEVRDRRPNLMAGNVHKCATPPPSPREGRHQQHRETTYKTTDIYDYNFQISLKVEGSIFVGWISPLGTRSSK